jgi:hypothetical protein
VSSDVEGEAVEEVAERSEVLAPLGDGEEAAVAAGEVETEGELVGSRAPGVVLTGDVLLELVLLSNGASDEGVLSGRRGHGDSPEDEVSVCGTTIRPQAGLRNPSLILDLAGPYFA